MKGGYLQGNGGSQEIFFDNERELGIFKKW